MVKFREGANTVIEAGVSFGPVDYVKYAESFGATGLRRSCQGLAATLDQAFQTEGPVVVQIPVDYRQFKTKIIIAERCFKLKGQ